MKVYLFASLLSLLLTSGGQEGVQMRQATAECIALADAEKIIGQAVVLTEHGDEVRNKVKRHTCTYSATAPDAATHKTGHLYYLLEEYADEASAKKTMDEIIADNADMSGLEYLSDWGNQAFFHTDEKNFCLLMVRKGNKIIRFKVNRITGKTSVSALKEVMNNTVLTL